MKIHFTEEKVKNGNKHKINFASDKNKSKQNNLSRYQVNKA